jgi:predicted transcriptional regulator
LLWFGTPVFPQSVSPIWPLVYRIEIIDPLDSQSGPATVNDMKSDTARDTLVPSGLLPEIKAAAEEEHRAPGELVGEAVERYLSERRWFRKDEVHTKIAEGLESLRQGKGLDGEAVMAELLAELDGPEPAR